jgi:hypothetical protein
VSASRDACSVEEGGEVGNEAVLVRERVYIVFFLRGVITSSDDRVPTR